MVGKQPCAHVPDPLTITVRCCLNHEIAFRVGAHRPVIEIGRADAQDTVVNDHHLGVHHGVRDTLARSYLGAHQAHTFTDTGLLERAQELNAPVAHGVILEPVLGRVRRDQQDLQIWVRAQALGERLGHGDAGQKLVLDIDLPFGRRDHVGEQRFDLSNLLLAIEGR